MNKLFSIKEVRLEKGISIEELAQRLKLSPLIIKKIENNEELPDKYKPYEKNFRNSILKLLDLYEVSGIVKINEIREDYTKLFLTIFSLSLVCIILFSLSYDIYKIQFKT